MTPEIPDLGLSALTLQRARIDPRSLTPQQMIQLQRTIGNRGTASLLGVAHPKPVPEATPIQRQGEAKAGGAVEVTAQSMAVTLNFEPSKTVKSKYAKVKFATPVAVKGELKAKNEFPANAGMESKSDGAKAAKTSVEVYKAKALDEGKSKLAKLAYQDIDDSGWEVEKVEWENEMAKEEGDTGDKVSIATGVKVSFKNGDSHVVKATLFEKEAGSGISGPKFEMEHTLKLAEEKLWENDSAQLSVNGEFKLKAEISPNWKNIFIELAKSGGRQVARNFARAAMQGMVNFFLGAGGLITGGIITVAAAVAEMKSIAEIKECKKAARAALEGYVHGFCIAWGIEEYGTSGSDKWFYEGLNAGKTRLKEQVVKIQKHPVFAPWNFTEAELIPGIKARLKEHAATVYNQVEAEMKTKIYTEYVLAFYDKRKNSFLTPTYIARKDAIWVARGLLLDDPEGLIPKE